MTIRFHQGDLPDLRAIAAMSRSTPRRKASTPGATGSAWSSSRRATAAPTSCRSPPGADEAPNLAAAPRRPPRSPRSSTMPASTSPCSSIAFGVMAEPVFCTKIASKLARTYTDRHGLKDLVKDLLDIDLSKQQQSSDWAAIGAERGAARLRRGRRPPSARAQGQARRRLAREGRAELAAACFRFLADPRPARPRRLGRRGHLRPLSVRRQSPINGQARASRAGARPHRAGREARHLTCSAYHVFTMRLP